MELLQLLILGRLVIASFSVIGCFLCFWSGAIASKVERNPGR